MELHECGSHVYVGCLCPGPVDTEFNQIANVQFRLKGIQPGFCVDYAFKQMKKRKVIIIPAMHIKAVVILGRFLPQNFYIRLVSHQQKKKIYP